MIYILQVESLVVPVINNFMPVYTIVSPHDHCALSVVWVVYGLWLCAGLVCVVVWLCGWCVFVLVYV